MTWKLIIIQFIFYVQFVNYFGYFRDISQSLLPTWLIFRPDVIEKGEAVKGQFEENFLTYIVTYRENYSVIGCPQNKGYNFILLSPGKAKAHVPKTMIKI